MTVHAPKIRREDGRTAIRRINQMHRSYEISNEDMRYVLCTFVVMPKRWLDAYEEAHFGFDEGARRVSDATLDLMAGWYGPLAPVVRGASMALLDDALLEAFRYEPPKPAVRAAVRTALKLRAKAVRLLPPRRTPHYARQNSEIKGYPNGFRVAELGTFPARRTGSCPVPHGEGPAAS